MERQGWASFLLRCVCTSICALLISIQQGAVDPAAIQQSTYVTAVGQQKIINMPDGSGMQLNTHSLVSVELQPRYRAVTVHLGEALLRVAADPRPLVMHLGRVDFEPTGGTSAHVRLGAGGGARVDVLEGEGWVLPAGDGHSFQPLRVSAGNSFSLHNDVGIMERFDTNEMSRRLAWTRGQIVLAGECLRDAVAEFNRYNRVQLVIGDDSIAKLSTGGTFYAVEPDTFARSLNQLFGIHAVRMSPRGDMAGADVLMLVGAGYSGI